MRKYVFTKSGVVDVSGTDCALLYDDVVDQIECEEQKRRF